ncbi:hypothetical protein GCM10009106_03030 [Sphingomonas japonica]
MLAREGIGGAVLAIGPIGGPVRLVAWGEAAPGQPMRVGDRFRLASLAKPLTAATALALVRLGKLRLDRPLPETANGATLRQLLSHSGGWDRALTFDPIGDPVSAQRIGLADPDDCRVIANRMPANDFRPGERYAYSNIGYCRIGQAIERAARLDYAEAVARLILRPRRSGLAYLGLPSVTHPSRFSPNAWRALGPAGGWTGSALDYWRFAAGPVDPLVRFRPPFAVAGQSHYGLGWRIRPDGTLTHFGAIPGIFALVVRTPTHAAVLLTNGRPFDDEATSEALIRSLTRAMRRP